jgi:hypothetical protein
MEELLRMWGHHHKRLSALGPLCCSLRQSGIGVAARDWAPHPGDLPVPGAVP